MSAPSTYFPRRLVLLSVVAQERKLGALLLHFGRRSLNTAARSKGSIVLVFLLVSTEEVLVHRQVLPRAQNAWPPGLAAMTGG
jgi:hypothetical protein